MIRVFQETDSDRLVEIWLKTSVLAHNFIPEEYWISHVGDMKDIYLPGSKNWVWMDLEDVVQGFISMRECHVVALFVDPSQQGKGIGSGLLNHVKNLYPRLTLHVYSKNEPSVLFYQRHGLEIRKASRCEATGERELLMEWVRS